MLDRYTNTGKFCPPLTTAFVLALFYIDDATVGTAIDDNPRFVYRANHENEPVRIESTARLWPHNDIGSRLMSNTLQRARMKYL